MGLSTVPMGARPGEACAKPPGPETGHLLNVGHMSGFADFLCVTRWILPSLHSKAVLCYSQDLKLIYL